MWRAVCSVVGDRARQRRRDGGVDGERVWTARCGVDLGNAIHGEGLRWGKGSGGGDGEKGSRASWVDEDERDMR